MNWNLGFEDICKERHVRIAYNNHPQHFEISDQSGEMVKLRDIPSQAFPSVGFYGVSKQWEIQELDKLQLYIWYTEFDNRPVVWCCGCHSEK